jgi:HEAT repeat protein
VGKEPERLSPLVLRQLFKSERGEVREAALSALIAMGNDPVIPDLRELLPEIREMLKDKEPGVRGAAVRVLGALGDKESLPQIRELLQDESEFVRNAVHDVLSESLS